jgi:hypothetical protein
MVCIYYNEHHSAITNNEVVLYTDVEKLHAIKRNLQKCNLIFVSIQLYTILFKILDHKCQPEK